MWLKLFATLGGFLLSTSLVADSETGDIKEVGGSLQVWYQAADEWLTPEVFFEREISRLNGPTYGRTSKYPDYNSVQEWDTLIDILPDGRSCPMVFFHARWRRLPDVLALDERLRNYGGCKDVFNY